MKDYSLYQIAQPEHELSADQWAELYADFPPQILTNEQFFKLRIGAWMHHLGVHHWVVWKTYDPISQRIIDQGRVCAFCPTGRLTR